MGSGSADQVPPATGDDQEFERNETVSVGRLASGHRRFFFFNAFAIDDFSGDAQLVQDIGRAKRENRDGKDRRETARPVATEHRRECKTGRIVYLERAEIVMRASPN